MNSPQFRLFIRVRKIFCLSRPSAQPYRIRDEAFTHAICERRKARKSLAQHGPSRGEAAMKGQVLGKQMNDFLPHCRRPARSEAKRNNVKIQKLSDVPFAVPQAFSVV